jgi:hypothetical protein
VVKNKNISIKHTAFKASKKLSPLVVVMVIVPPNKTLTFPSATDIFGANLLDINICT